MDKATRTKTYVDRVAWATNILNKIAPEGPVVGVEVGLWKADFAVEMLKANPRLHWYGVDPYMEYVKQKRPLQWEAIYQRVVGKLSPFGDRAHLIRKPSNIGINLVPDKVDLGFIDGNHDYPFVLEDITLLEKKVRPGGIVSGHDYALPGVRQAVDEYSQQFGRLLWREHFDAYEVWWWMVP